MNSYEKYNEYLFYKAGQMGIPYSGCFELTSRCNLDCKMCYIHKRANDREVIQKEWVAEQWIDLAKDCGKQGMLNLLLTGGEPLLRKDFFDIYEACKKLGMLVSINSNGTCINQSVINYFQSNAPARINITLYGASEKTYEALCGDGGAYEKVVKTILALKKVGVLVKINYSVTPYNIQDMEKVFAFAKENYLPIQYASYMFPPLRACELADCTTERLTAEQSAEAAIKYDRLRFDGDELKARWSKKLQEIEVIDLDKECKNIPDSNIKCRAGSSTFWVTWDGKMRPCGMMTTPSADLNQVSFGEAWESIKNATKEIYLPKQCVTCSLRSACNQCAAICYAETGEFSSVPEYMCERTKAYLKKIQSELI